MYAVIYSNVRFKHGKLFYLFYGWKLYYIKDELVVYYTAGALSFPTRNPNHCIADLHGLGDGRGVIRGFWYYNRLFLHSKLNSHALLAPVSSYLF